MQSLNIIFMTMNNNNKFTQIRQRNKLYLFLFSKEVVCHSEGWIPFVPEMCTGIPVYRRTEKNILTRWVRARCSWWTVHINFRVASTQYLATVKINVDGPPIFAIFDKLTSIGKITKMPYVYLRHKHHLEAVNQIISTCCCRRNNHGESSDYQLTAHTIEAIAAHNTRG